MLNEKSKLQMLLILFLSLVFLSLQNEIVQSKEFPDKLQDELRFKDRKLLKNLRNFELIYPQDVQTIPSDSCLNCLSQDETIERSIAFVHNGKTVILDLVPNKNLISPRYKEKYYLPDGNAAFRKRTHDCFFHGYVRDKENSNLALTTCEVLHGYFRINDETFFIHPLLNKNQKSVGHVVYSPGDVMGNVSKCGHDERENTQEDSINFLDPFPQTEHHRTRREVLTEIKYVELILVNDYSQFQEYGNDIAATKLRAISIANVVDSIDKKIKYFCVTHIYKVHNIRIALVMVETWTSGDLISVVTNSDTTLDNFLTYKNDVLDVNEDTKDHDNAQLLTQTVYDNSVVGLAFLRTICRTNSAGIDSDNNQNPSAAYTAAIVAHEMGHNFGLNHDDDYKLEISMR